VLALNVLRRHPRRNNVQRRHLYRARHSPNRDLHHSRLLMTQPLTPRLAPT
jgi:hypothetical protein